MLTVNGKEVLFQTSFMIEHDGTATVSLPINSGIVARFEILPLPPHLQDFQSVPAKSDRSNWEQEIVPTVEDGGIKFAMPYLREHQANVTPVFVFIQSIGANVSARIGRQQLAGAMLVHFEVYVDPVAGSER